MSHFVVNLSDPEKDEPKKETPKFEKESPKFEPVKKSSANSSTPQKGGCGRILKISGVAVAILLLFGTVAGYFYWQSLKSTPQYSLALLVEAARQKDQKAIDELVDTDAVVESFLPQVIDKAVELYGKNLPAEKIAKVKETAAPLMPAIKQRAREEVPRVIAEKTDKFSGIPYWAIAIGAGYYLDIKPEGETATVLSKIPERQFELTMKKNGDKWRVVGIKDEALATRIAQTIGQELIAISSKESLKKASEKMKAPELQNVQKKLEDLFK